VVLVRLKPIFVANWLFYALRCCWFSHLACKTVPEMTYKVSSGTLFVQLGGKKGLGAQKVAANFSDVETAALQRDKEQAQAVTLSSSQPTVSRQSAEQTRLLLLLLLLLLLPLPSLF